MKEVDLSKAALDLESVVNLVKAGTSILLIEDGSPVAEMVPFKSRGRKSDIFLSYSRHDIGYARIIRTAFTESGLDTWIDWDRIPVGKDWWEQIQDAIVHSNVFVVLLSEWSIQSNVCRDEIERAVAHRKRIVPILLDALSVSEVERHLPGLPRINWGTLGRDDCFSIQDSDDPTTVAGLEPKFAESFERIRETLLTDWDWVNTHTEILDHASKGFVVGGPALYDLLVSVEHAPDSPALPPKAESWLSSCEEAEQKRLSGEWFTHVSNNPFPGEVQIKCRRCGCQTDYTPREGEKPLPACPRCRLGELDDLREYARRFGGHYGGFC